MNISDSAIQRAQILMAAQSHVRDLVNGPPDDIHPQSLAAAAEALGSIDHVEVDVWDIDRCKAENCVGIEAVGRGSVHPGCMIHIKYRPPGAQAHIALVGKGVTFDAGGYSIKPSSGMQTMRCDMGGAGTMLGVAKAAAELGVPVAMDTFLGAVENLIDADAYKLGDILSYPNGVTVEIHNTDAEGRLVLADCLIEACKIEGVQHVVDAATLTGACVVAVGGDFTGLFTDDDGLADSLSTASAACSEGLWRLPLHAPYNEMLKGEWSQIKNVGGRAAGATTAALFLQHFVTKGTSWAHLDVAGSAFHDKGNRRYAAGATGEMVRSLTSWIASLG
jgi:leucyl aminopeptidase